MTADFDTFDRFRRQLASKGFSEPLQWWDEQLARFYASGAKRFAARVGRGGAKSTTMVDAAITEAVAGDWTVPPGEVHFFAFISQNKSEASQRLRQIAGRLRALGLPFDGAGDELVLRDLPRGFRVFACQIGAVSGFRCFGFCADELSKWTNADKSANPASEVVASVRAMTVTHPGAREFFVSSPLGMRDLHYEIIEAGDSASQVVAIAPTWVANPSITQQQTRELEPDDRVWRREYLAVPQHSALGAFPVEDIEAAFKPREHFSPARKTITMDPSSGGTRSQDRFTVGVWSWMVDTLDALPPWKVYLHNKQGQVVTHPWGEKIVRPEYANWTPRGRPYLRLHDVHALDGGFSANRSSEDVADWVTDIAKRHRVQTLHTDQHAQFYLSGQLQRRGLTVHGYDVSNRDKSAAVVLVRRWLADRLISLPPHEKLKQELLSFEESVTKTGLLKYEGRRSHDDFVSLLILLAVAEQGEFPLNRTPHRAPPPRGHLSDTEWGRDLLSRLIH